MGVKSELNVGSTFYFTASFNKQPGKVSEKNKVNADIEGIRILVVDDNNSSREIFSNILSSFGLRIDQASTGKMALAQLEEARDNDPYKLVLMDWHMPAMDGIAVTEAIQNKKNLGETPNVIMVTAFSRDEAIQAAKNVNISVFLTKPVTPSNLYNAIMSAMGYAINLERRSSGSQQKAKSAILKLQGAKVLLVEDNEMNQELALELLSSNGVIVELAENGQEALDRLEANESYDGVLMDCQMPIMDGYTATRKLREQERFKNLPVLAMTANAMLGDKEKAIASGMNDHISKPINVNQMFIIMAEWITPANPSDEIIIKSLESDRSDSEVLPKLPGIEQDNGLMNCQRDIKLYRKLLNKYRENEADFMERFKQAQSDPDTESTTRLAHTLKTVSGNIGALEVQQAAAKLETACKQKLDEQTIEKLLKQLVIPLTVVIDGLQILETQSEAKPPCLQDSNNEIDRDKLKQLVQQLK